MEGSGPDCINAFNEPRTLFATNRVKCTVVETVHP